MNGWTRLVESRLLRKGGVYVFSSWISQGVMLLAWMVLPWKLSKEQIGQFALISFVVDLATRLIIMGMDSAILRFYVEKDRRKTLLGAAGLWLAVGCGLAAALLWLTRNEVPWLIKGLAPVYGDLLWLVWGTAAATAFSTVVFNHYVASDDPAQFGKLSILRSGLLGGGYLTAAWCGLGVAGLVGAQLIAALTIVGWFGWRGEFRGAGNQPCGRALREVAVYGMPMTVYAVFGTLSDYAGRLFLDRSVTIGDLGVFQFYYQIANQVNGIWGSLNRAWTPHVFQLLTADRRSAFAKIQRAAVVATSVYAGGMVVGMLAGDLGLGAALVPAAYHARIGLFYLLLLGPLYCGVYIAAYPVFYFDKNTVRISLVQSVVSAITIVMTIYLTIRLRTDGAAFGWVLGLFATPLLYMVSFPRLMVELRPIAVIHLIWGVGGGLVVLSLAQLHSTGLAIAVLLAAMAGVIAFHWKTGRALAAGMR